MRGFGVKRQHLGSGLNEVRSWRPEQSEGRGLLGGGDPVSMKSGLGDRNNPRPPRPPRKNPHRLNEVRSWRPEQYDVPVHLVVQAGVSQ